MTDLPPVEYRRLGKSGLRVSVPILGAMSFGDPKWGVSVFLSFFEMVDY